MTTETNWAEQIGKPSLSSLREMVAALELDWDRLKELREARDSFSFDPDANTAPDGPGYANDAEAWAGENPDDAEELAELEKAAKPCGNECVDRDDAEQMIHEDALSVEVRSGWTTAGQELQAEEFAILLTTGGPAVRIRGELDEHDEPYRARLEVQDWGKPWTEYFEDGADEVCLAYARCFCFGSNR